eukprot:2512213-Rhodomonas_salina.2
MERLNLTPRGEAENMRVRITGLQNSTDLNGRVGYLKAEDKKTDRLIIVLADGGDSDGRLVKAWQADQAREPGAAQGARERANT